MFSTILVLLSVLAFATPAPRLGLNWKPEAQFGGFYQAAQLAEKEKEPFQILPGGSGTPTLQMLNSGQLEYAVVSADEILVSYERGAKDLVAVFATYQINPQILMAHSNQKYSGIKDILQDSAGTLLWQSGLPYAQYLLKKLGPPKTKMAPYSGGLGSFQIDSKISQQGFATSEPLIAKKAGLKIISFLISEEGYNPYTTVLVTKKSRLTKNPAEVQRMVRRVRQGWTEYLKDPSAINSTLHGLNPSQTLEILQESAKAQKPLIETEWTLKHGLGKMSLERWESLSQQLLDLKIIKGKPPVSELFTEL